MLTSNLCIFQRQVVNVCVCVLWLCGGCWAHHHGWECSLLAQSLCCGNRRAGNGGSSSGITTAGAAHHLLSCTFWRCCCHIHMQSSTVRFGLHSKPATTCTNSLAVTVHTLHRRIIFAPHSPHCACAWGAHTHRHFLGLGWMDDTTPTLHFALCSVSVQRSFDGAPLAPLFSFSCCMTAVLGRQTTRGGCRICSSVS